MKIRYIEKESITISPASSVFLKYFSFRSNAPRPTKTRAIWETKFGRKYLPGVPNSNSHPQLIKIFQSAILMPNCRAIIIPTRKITYFFSGRKPNFFLEKRNKIIPTTEIVCIAQIKSVKFWSMTLLNQPSDPQ